jgi:hypothetical protein
MGTVGKYGWQDVMEGTHLMRFACSAFGVWDAVEISGLEISSPRRGSKLDKDAGTTGEDGL